MILNKNIGFARRIQADTINSYDRLHPLILCHTIFDILNECVMVFDLPFLGF